MPKKKYNVTLSPAEESFLKSITHKGKNHSAREIIHAQILLHSNGNRQSQEKNLGEPLKVCDTYIVNLIS